MPSLAKIFGTTHHTNEKSRIIPAAARSGLPVPSPPVLCYPWTRNKGGNRYMHIVDLRTDDESAIGQVAALLMESFATNSPAAWPDLESGVTVVRESSA